MKTNNNIDNKDEYGKNIIIKNENENDEIKIEYKIENNSKK